MIIVEKREVELDLKRIRIARAIKGLTMSRLEEISGVERKTIARIEKGITKNVRMDTLKKLMNALGQEIDFFMTDNDIKDVVKSLQWWSSNHIESKIRS